MRRKADELDGLVGSQVPFLVMRGYSLRELTDYEDGPTLGEFADFHLAACGAIVEEKRTQLEVMTMALQGLFNAELVKDYDDGLKKAGELVRQVHSINDKRRPLGSEDGDDDGDGEDFELTERQRAVQDSLRELSKLNGILGRGKL